MNQVKRRSKVLPFRILAAFLLAVLLALPALAKIDVDFDPSLDFSKFRSFAFLGGVPNLTMLAVDPEVLDNHVHRAVSRELIQKGLREVQANQNPALVIRYWAVTSQQVNAANMGDWGPYDPSVNSYWAPMYNAVSAVSTKENALLIDLIDPRSKKLVWRLYLTRKFSTNEKEWKKADEEIARAFESFPPSAKEREAKTRERAAQPPK